MDTLGTLQTIPVSVASALIADAVKAMIATLPNKNSIRVASIDPTLSDTAAFCAHYQVGLNQAANCVIVEAKRADRTWYGACVVLGSTRADINGLARRTLDARRVSFAPMEEAVRQTSMEFGAITPIGLPAEWPILVDKAVVDSPLVIIGSGLRASKLLVPGSIFASLPNVKILEGLGRE